MFSHIHWEHGDYTLALGSATSDKKGLVAAAAVDVLKGVARWGGLILLMVVSKSPASACIVLRTSSSVAARMTSPVIISSLVMGLIVLPRVAQSNMQERS